MGVVLVCLAMLGVATVLTVRWRRAEFTPPAPTGGGWQDRARRAVWWVELTVLTVLFTGLLVIGAGGRLAMRLLGALGGDQAQGRITEADEVVGEVTIGGSIGFLVFVGLVAAGLTVVVFLLLRRFLPAGIAGGVLFGAGSLVVLGTRNDPLRAENRDFDLVGPWWVAIAVFAALALAHGVATTVAANRISAWLPLPGRNVRSLAYLLLLLLLPPFPVAIAAVIFVVVYATAGDVLSRLDARLAAPRAILVVRCAMVAVLVVALPGFVRALTDIAGRGPTL